jgi:hypothetical protein
VEEAVKALKDVKDKDDTEVIQKAMSTLSDAIQKVGAAMYADQGQATSDKEQGNTEAGSTEGPADAAAGPTVDAEFKAKE